MANNTFTKTIGSTERALKALLDRVLGATSTPFEWWTALVLLRKGASSAEDIRGQLVNGHVVRSADHAGEIIAEMQKAGLVESLGGDRYQLAPEGAARFQAISTEVQDVMAHVLSGVEESELAVVEKVLTGVLDRANRLLASA